mmetsp:Transcript_20316/g.28208  ORF Transcript_20316/g.28208 Transcript_20316/m.28208 type:complete len:356 (-) Transcript_20316:216-1283(-)
MQCTLLLSIMAVLYTQPMQLSNSGSKAKQDDWEINAEKLKFIFLRGGVLSSGGAAGNSFNFGKKEAATIGTRFFRRQHNRRQHSCNNSSDKKEKTIAARQENSTVDSSSETPSLTGRKSSSPLTTHRKRKRANSRDHGTKSRKHSVYRSSSRRPLRYRRFSSPHRRQQTSQMTRANDGQHLQRRKQQNHHHKHGSASVSSSSTISRTNDDDSDSSVRRKEEEIKKLDQIIPTSNTGYFRPKFELGYAPEELKIREQLVSPRVKKRSIFVGNLPLEFKTQDLIKLVKPYGELENCFVCLGEKAQLEGWRYGFAIFKSLEGAQRCYMELNSVTMNGQNLIVEPSRFNPEFEKHEDYL